MRGWTQAEVEFLNNNPRMTASQIAVILGRTRRGVLRKKERLKTATRPHRKQGALPGEQHPRAVLTNEKVREMRRLYATGISHHKLAVLFDVAFSTEWKAVTGRTWAHV